MYTLDVAVPCPLLQTFSYLSEDELAAGTRVLVPFGKRDLVGVVIGARSQEAASDQTASDFKLKAIRKALDSQPVYSAVLRELAK